MEQIINILIQKCYKCKDDFPLTEEFWNQKSDGYGKVGWHIDHIIPCDAFDLTDESQKYICFNWVNLQPLWYDENSIKSNKMPNGKYVENCSQEELDFYINELKEKIKNGGQ